MHISSPHSRVMRNTVTTENPETVRQPGFAVRLVDIAALNSDGNRLVTQRKMPALPIFDQAIAAFAQGTAFHSASGFIAVEDMQPGDWLQKTDGSLVQVNWIASSVFTTGGQNGCIGLTRIMADRFGLGRPQSSVTFGPAARLMHRAPGSQGSASAYRMMTPACHFEDGVNVIELTPPTPIRLFHIGLAHHAAVLANGLDVESYHPGVTPVAHLSQTLQRAFCSLFPHVRDLKEFGPMRYGRAPDSIPSHDD